MTNEETYFNPFPGLRSFEEEEEYLFFGREKQIDELINKLSKTRFLAVVGASGSGKSSLVKSGLLPSLHSGYLAAAGSGWRICTFRPGSDPIGNMAEALCSDEILGEDEEDHTTPSIIESILRRNDQGVGETIRQLSRDHTQNILIVVDQFEELFRFSKYEKAEDKGTRDSVSFINLLLAASRYSSVPIYVVFTMRSDFLGDCTEFRGLPEAINDGQYLIPRMTREERKAAITGPVAVGGATMSQALLTRLLNDVGDNPDQLPILQHALMRTWEHWHKNSSPDDPLDLVHYEAIGTMSKALSLHAEEAYFDLGNDKDKETCKKLFKSLTEKRDDGRGIRRPSIIKEICELAETNLKDVSRIIDIFRLPGRSFLMPPAGTELTEDTIIDISHESLMRVWERLITWVQEEIESAELYTRLAKSAALYQEGKTGLWRDPELLMAVNWRANQNPNPVWARRYDPSFDRAINYLDYSQSEKDRELKGAEKKRKAAIVRLRIFMSIITLALCASVVMGIKAWKSKQDAEASRQEAEVNRRDAVLAMDDAVEKQKLADSLKKVAQNDRLIASVAKDSALKSSERADAALLKSLESLDFARRESKRAGDSAISATTQRNNAVKNADAAVASATIATREKAVADSLRMFAEIKNIALKSGQLINEPGEEMLSLQLAFLSYAVNRGLGGPLQSRIIYEALKAQLTRYYTKELRSRKDLKYETGGYDLRNLVFISKNEFVVAGDGGTLKKYGLSGTPVEIVETKISSKKFTENFSSLCFTPDKKWIIAGTTTGSVVAWDMVNASECKVLHKGTGKAVFLYAASAGNDYSIIAAFDNGASLFKAKEIKEKKETVLKITDTTALANPAVKLKAATCYTAAGNTLHFITAGDNVLYDQTIDAAGVPGTYKTFPGDLIKSISVVSVTRDGKFVSAGSSIGNIIVYKYENGGYKYLRSVKGHLSGITALNFSSDDSVLVSGSLDHSIRASRILKPKSGEEDLVFKEKEAWVRGLAISPKDDRYVLGVGQSGLIQVWPANLEMLLNELKGIKDKKYKTYLSSPLNEIRFKEEFDENLYKNLWSGTKDGKALYPDFKTYWESLQKKYLNE
jgi:WD40 repeat protein/energy-coupling factor transporter ATP-binding protein EcfA2